MRTAELIFASLLVTVVPASVGPGAAVRDDPLSRVREALEQGRHWQASRLLEEIEPLDAPGPEAVLLAARADAGRGIWRRVAERLHDQPWLDTVANGEGRALLARAWLETDAHARAVLAYRTFLDYSMERRPRALAEIGLGRALESAGQPREAAAAYRRAGLTLPALKPWVSLRAAEALAEIGDTSAVRGFLAQTEDISGLRRQLALIRAYEQAGDAEGALTRLLNVADDRSAAERRGELYARAARIHLARGDTATAAGTLRTAIRLDPSHALASAELLFELPGLTDDDYADLARAFDRSRAPGDAARAYRRLMQSRPTGRSDGWRTRLKIGELHFRAGQYWMAIEELEKLVAEGPGTAIESRAQYLIARATYRRGWRREGRARFREVASRYPGTSSALRALALLGDLYENAGNDTEARSIFEELVRDYPTSRSARRAEFHLGIFDYLAGDHESATRHMDRVRRSERRGELHVASTYWAARARVARADSGLTSDARHLFQHVRSDDPYGYYGLLAAERLGVDPWAELPPGPDPEPVDTDVLRRLDLIDLLKEAALLQEAETVLESILDSAPRRPEALLGLSNALADRGIGQDAVRLAWRAHARLRGRWSASVLRAIYPFPFRDIIRAEARRQNLPLHLVAAIARQESAFSPDVVSRAGARGLLQLMPETGRWWANRMGVPDYSLSVLFHPEINVHLGTAYLADLERRYDDLQLSLIAYNAGPTRARRWRQRLAYRIDPELFAEQIPFSETRTYVKNIQTQLQIYRHLYNEPDFSDPAD